VLIVQNHRAGLTVGPISEKDEAMRLTAMIILLGCSFAGISPGMAQATLPGPDALGLYFDVEAQTRDIDVEAGASFEIYLILTNPTMNSIEGWESAVILTNGNSVTTTEFPVGSQPLLNGPQDWAVSMTIPMPCNVLTKLAVFTVLSVSDEHATFFLGNISAPSLAGDYPSVCLTGGDWTALDLSSEDPSLPVAEVNGSTPDQKTTWGAVKSLFR
jgi:hypothetical protein